MQSPQILTAARVLKMNTIENREPVLDHLALTKMVRAALKQKGIKASVRKKTICQSKIISVSTGSYEQDFTAAEQSQILQIGLDNGFTKVQEQPIEDNGCHPHGTNFYLDQLFRRGG